MEYDLLVKEKSKFAANDLRDNLKIQMEIERSKKNRKSVTNLHNAGRHNPITNPIEVHYDNPYLLKDMFKRNQM